MFALTPGDYTAQCLSLKSAGANYAYLGNTAASNISVLKACKTAGVDVQFMGNVWGMDENAAKAAGDAADGVIFPLRTAVVWGGNAPGMKTVTEISKMSDPTGKAYRPVHYIAGVCSALYMKEAHRLGGRRTAAPPARTSPRASTRRRIGCPPAWKASAIPRPGPTRTIAATLKVDLYRSKVSGRDRRRPQRPDEEGHDQAREGQDRRAAAQAGMAGLVISRLAGQRHTHVVPRESGGSSTPRLLELTASVAGILGHPPSRVMTADR